VSVSGGSFSAGRVFRGGAQAARPSQYLLGWYPCQQADGDADDEQVTDRSGNEAHASIGSLTSAEAWANAGYFSSLDEVGHFAEIPLAKWTHRYSTATLLVFGWAYAQTDGANLCFILGNGSSDTISGGNLGIAANGSIQFNLRGPGYNSNSANSGVATFASASLHSYAVCVDCVARSVTFATDGAIVKSGNTTIPSAAWEAADAAVTRGMSIGGRSGQANTNNLVANRARHLQFYSLTGMPAPTNLAALVRRMHDHPRLPLRDSDFAF
jgi:hypothetical protein